MTQDLKALNQRLIRLRSLYVGLSGWKKAAREQIDELKDCKLDLTEEVDRWRLECQKYSDKYSDALAKIEEMKEREANLVNVLKTNIDLTKSIFDKLRIKI